MPKPRNGKRKAALIILLAILLVAPFGASQDDGSVDFDPFRSRASDTVSPPPGTLDQGPVISQIELNNDEISMAFKIISDFTGWSIFPTAEVGKAKISLWAKDVPAEWLLDTVVTLAGFTYRREGKAVTVMTHDEYAQHYGLSKEVIALEYAGADAVANVLKPFLSKLGKSVVHQRTNAIVLFDSPANLETIGEVVAKLDIPDDAGEMLEVVDLKYMDSLELADTLQRVFAPGEPTSSQPPRTATDAPSPTRAGDRITETQATTAAGLSSPQAGVGVYALNRTNQLILKALQGDMEKLKKLVDKLDTYVEPTSRNYHFTYIDASEVFTGLERILDLPTRGAAYGRSQGQGSRETGKPCGITLVTKTNSILLTAPPSVHRVMTSIVKTVDVPSTYEAGIIRVYKIENADVDEVAQAIRELLQRREEQEVRPGEPKYREQPTQETEAPDQTQFAESEKYVPQIEARIAVSKATNSVIVQATARQHRELEKLVEELDRRRRQVLIESTIVEVTTSEGLGLGVELSYASQDGFTFSAFGLSTGLDPTTGARNIIVSPGGSAAVLRPDNVQAIVKAVASDQNVRVTSAPRILVNDNAAGFINSIAEEPYTQTSQGEVTETVSFGGFVEAGTQFMITPHISESDYLRVEYEITLNSFRQESTDLSIPPPRNTSSIRSEATVPNGHTIVVGGLQTSDEQATVNKVPLLGDIPLIGLLFQNTAIEKTYKTTYLFITPVIMEKEDFGDLRGLSEQAIERAKMNDRPEKPSETRTDDENDGQP
jgi:type II secretion system protein D